MTEENGHPSKNAEASVPKQEGRKMSDASNFLQRVFIGDRIIWVMLAGLFFVSFLVIYSATSQFVVNKANDYKEAVSHGGFLLACLIGALLSVHYLQPKHFRNAILGIFILAILLLSILFLGLNIHLQIGGFPLFGVVSENNASRWISLFGITFQPSELAKIGLVASIAHILTVQPTRRLIQWPVEKLRNWGKFQVLTEKKQIQIVRFLLALLPIILFDILIVKENLSTAMLFGFIGMIIIFLSGVWDKAILWLFLALTLIGAIGVVTIHNMDLDDAQNSSLKRLSTWKTRIDEFAGGDKYDYNAKSMQIIHSQIAIARGETFGMGPGNSIERSKLPQAYADFVFAIFVEEYGFIASLFLIGLYLTLFYRCGIIARRTKDPYLALLVFGLGAFIVVQALMSIAVTVHLGPVTGQPLPLISRGKSAILITCFSIACIQKIAYISKQEQKKEDSSTDTAENEIKTPIL
ncbi:MAG: FtsW/RodA/SpoVE family cell cycle protein [Paludibacteraceae bacterium]|jgi:cell division protein FtsW|nr:FtsW/RodA/SpoVE family cell cycle protein [Paludibacteraceae bacterium]